LSPDNDDIKVSVTPTHPTQIEGERVQGHRRPVARRGPPVESQDTWEEGDEWPDYPEIPEFPEEPDGGTGGAGHDSSFDRRTNVGATILGAVLGPVYGKRRVPGYCYLTFDARSSDADYWYLGYAFAVGESVAVADIKMNDRSGVPYVEVGLGTSGSTNRPPRFMFLTSYMPGLVNIGFKYPKESMPGSINMTALISGKKIHDIRDGSYPSDTTTNHSNPALIAHDICTDKEMWKGLDDLEVNLDQLKDIADWCDEQVDSENRWHFHGRLDVRDTDKALAFVLRHCFATPYVYDQKMYFIADMPPRPVADVWSVSATTWTADASGGNATSKLSSGDNFIVYVSSTHYVYTVDTVTDDDTFSTVESASHSGVTVRPITNLLFQQDDYILPPKGSDIDFAQIPDVVIVKYPQGDDGEWATIRCEDPDGYTSGDPRSREVTVNGIKTGSCAARWGNQERRSWKFCLFQWEMTLGPEAAQLAPGDIFRISTEDGLTGTLVRCIKKREEFLSGNFQITARQFHMGVYSDDTADEDSPPDDYYTPPPIIPGGDTPAWEPVTHYQPGSEWKIVFMQSGEVVMQSMGAVNTRPSVSGSVVGYSVVTGNLGTPFGTTKPLGGTVGGQATMTGDLVITP
jgi:hypothetical protein